jgi:sugar phosphate isomerase/epimerase
MVAAANELEYELRCARSYGIGCELQVFGFPEHLSRDITPELQRMIRRLDGIKGPIGCHGPFIDTVHYSLDAEIQDVCRRRYLEAFDIAEAIGSSYVLFHSQYNPIIKVPAYPKIYQDQSLRFWPELIEEAEVRRIPIYIENMFDDDPQPLRRLADQLNSPYFQLCLDIAHAAIFSNVDLAEWVAVFKPHLRHVHMNDCHGEWDDHLGLGEGVLDIPRAIALLKATGRPLTYALETGKHTAVSLRYLRLSKI